MDFLVKFVREMRNYWFHFEVDNNFTFWFFRKFPEIPQTAAIEAIHNSNNYKGIDYSYK